MFLFVSNVGVMMAISYLYNATFLMLARAERPFRTSVLPIVAVFFAEIALFTPILLTGKALVLLLRHLCHNLLARVNSNLCSRDVDVIDGVYRC